MPTLKDILRKHATGLSHSQIDTRIDHAKQNIDVSIMNTLYEIENAEKRYIEACTEFPYDASAIIEAQEEIEQYQSGLESLEKLRDEHFGKEEKDEIEEQEEIKPIDFTPKLSEEPSKDTTNESKT